jgi:hypothetical protein
MVLSFIDFVANMPKTFTTTIRVWNGKEFETKQYDFKLTVDVIKVKNQITQAYRNKSRKSVDGALIVERY